MQNSSEEREKTRKQVVTLIRSLLISSKGGVPIEKINRKFFKTSVGPFFCVCKTCFWQALQLVLTEKLQMQLKAIN